MWVEDYRQLLQTQALLALAGAEGITADPHKAFADAFTPRSREQDREARRRQIEALMSAAG